MSERLQILFVDDEPNVLHAIRRQLRNRFHLVTAASGEEGLEALSQGTFALIVSDMRMPGMAGPEFLARARRLRPDAVRMVLSGDANLDAAIDAVNAGAISRYFRKPTEPETLIAGLEAGLEQYRTLQAEKRVLNQTLVGAIKALVQVLDLSQSGLFGSSEAIVAVAEGLARQLGRIELWEVRVAAHLAHLGCVGLAPAVIEEAMATPVPGPEFTAHAAIGRGLLEHIPRLQVVAQVVGQHATPPDPAAWPADMRDLPPVDQMALAVGAAVEIVRRIRLGQLRSVALLQMADRYPPAVIAALTALDLGTEPEPEFRSVGVFELLEGMTLARDVMLESGLLLAREGTFVSAVLLSRLRSFHAKNRIAEPLLVMLPRQAA